MCCVRDSVFFVVCLFCCGGVWIYNQFQTNTPHTHPLGTHPTYTPHTHHIHTIHPPYTHYTPTIHPPYTHHTHTTYTPQLKLLQILAVLGAGDKAASEHMYTVVAETMRRGNTGHTIGNAIVYECVRTITTIYPNPPLLQSGVWGSLHAVFVWGSTESTHIHADITEQNATHTNTHTKQNKATYMQKSPTPTNHTPPRLRNTSHSCGDDCKLSEIPLPQPQVRGHRIPLPHRAHQPQVRHGASNGCHRVSRGP